MQAGALKGNFATFSAGDRDFHRSLWTLSGNAFLAKALETITMPQFAYIFVRSVDETAMDLPAIVKQHRDWLDFISTASPAKAAAYTRKITTSFWQQVRNSIAR
jgi:DNA-binding GntR family transcriptional regulator